MYVYDLLNVCKAPQSAPRPLLALRLLQGKYLHLVLLGSGVDTLDLVSTP